MTVSSSLESLRIDVVNVRREIAGLADAVRELTATIAKAADPLAEAARAVPDIADAISTPREDLADIATAVESLVTSIDDRSRRWFGRRRPVRRREVSA